MATAGSPLKAMPSSARTSNSARQPGTNEQTSVSAAAAKSDTTITDFRPHASESAPAIRTDAARKAVVSESERLLVAALTPNSREKTGSSGCTQYSSAKVEKPAENNARLVRRNAGVPRSMNAADSPDAITGSSTSIHNTALR